MQPFNKARLKHCYIFLYPILYMIGFCLLEKYIRPEHIIEVPLDRQIPFCEYFIIPYYLWFAYVAVTVAFFFFFLDLGDFYRLTSYLFFGMTIFLVISAVYPNGLNLRPTQFPRDNIFTTMVKGLYYADTSTNVLPSIHVYNSICIHVGISKNDYLSNKKWISYSSLVLMVLIILSTMFLKQHSVIDVITGIVMAVAFYPMFYVKNWIPYRSQCPLKKKKNMVHSPV